MFCSPRFSLHGEVNCFRRPAFAEAFELKIVALFLFSNETYFSCGFQLECPMISSQLFLFFQCFLIQFQSRKLDIEAEFCTPFDSAHARVRQTCVRETVILQ